MCFKNKWGLVIDEDDYDDYLVLEDDNGIGYRFYLSSVVQNSDSGREFLKKVLDKLNS